MDYTEFKQYTGIDDFTAFDVGQIIYLSSAIPDVGGKPALAKWIKTNRQVFDALVEAHWNSKDKLSITQTQIAQKQLEIGKLHGQVERLEAQVAQATSSLAQSAQKLDEIWDERNRAQGKAYGATQRAEQAESERDALIVALGYFGLDADKVKVVARALAVDGAARGGCGTLPEGVNKALSLF